MQKSKSLASLEKNLKFWQQHWACLPTGQWREQKVDPWTGYKFPDAFRSSYFVLSLQVSVTIYYVQAGVWLLFVVK